jgi:hypothetical protein
MGHAPAHPPLSRANRQLARLLRRCPCGTSFDGYDPAKLYERRRYITKERKHAREAAATFVLRGVGASIMQPGQRRDESRWIASSTAAIQQAFAAAYRRFERAHRQARPVDQRR